MPAYTGAPGLGCHMDAQRSITLAMHHADFKSCDAENRQQRQSHGQGLTAWQCSQRPHGVSSLKPKTFYVTQAGSPKSTLNILNATTAIVAPEVVSDLQNLVSLLQTGVDTLQIQQDAH